MKRKTLAVYLGIKLIMEQGWKIVYSMGKTIGQ